MSKTQFFVVLSTCLATNLGSYGVGDSFPCESQEEADRMVDAGQAKHPVTEQESQDDLNALQLTNNDLTVQLNAANEKLNLPFELPAEVKADINELEQQLVAANKKLAAPVTLPEDVEKQISELTQALAKTTSEKDEFEKNLEEASREIISVNKKLKAAEIKLKKQAK